MDVGISNACRLVRTELNFVNNQAAFESIEDAGMKYYRFIATLDRRTSDKCRSMDGEVFFLRRHGVRRTFRRCTSELPLYHCRQPVRAEQGKDWDANC